MDFIENQILKPVSQIYELIVEKLDGYNKGLDRDSIMSKAAEKYSKEWGSDKVKYLGKN